MTLPIELAPRLNRAGGDWSGASVANLGVVSQRSFSGGSARAGAGALSWADEMVLALRRPVPYASCVPDGRTSGVTGTRSTRVLGPFV